MPNHLPYNFGNGRLFPDPFTLRDEANAIVAFAFRMGPIESLHQGQFSSLLENPELSRLTDAELKTLMDFARERVATLLRVKDNPAEYVRFILMYNAQYCQKWER